jgi:O-antigen ligase
VTAGLIEAVVGMRQLYGFERSNHALFNITGTFLNPGPYACFLAVILPMAVWGICEKGFGVMRVVSGLSVGAILMVLPATMSRAAWVAAVVGCGVVFCPRMARIFTNWGLYKKYLIVGGLLIAVIGGCIGMYRMKSDSADGRAFIWRNTLELVREKPLGVGIGNFSGSYGPVQAAYFAAGKGTDDEQRIAGNPEYAFNEYLQIAAEQGIVPFLMFLFIVVYSIYQGIRRKEMAATASLVALTVVAGMTYPFSLFPFLLLPVFLLASINGSAAGFVLPRKVVLTVLSLSVAGMAFCFYNCYPTFKAEKEWKKKVQPFQSVLPHEELAEQYGELYPHLSERIQFLFEYAQCLSKSGQSEKSNEVLLRAMQISCDPMLYNIMGKNCQRMKRYGEAEKWFKHAANIVPNRIYPYYLMALMYRETGETAKAKATARIVLTKEPKVHSQAIEEMREEAKKIIQLPYD